MKGFFFPPNDVNIIIFPLPKHNNAFICEKAICTLLQIYIILSSLLFMTRTNPRSNLKYKLLWPFFWMKRSQKLKQSFTRNCYFFVWHRLQCLCLAENLKFTKRICIWYLTFNSIGVFIIGRFEKYYYNWRG